MELNLSSFVFNIFSSILITLITKPESSVEPYLILSKEEYYEAHQYNISCGGFVVVQKNLALNEFANDIETRYVLDKMVLLDRDDSKSWKEVVGNFTDYVIYPHSLKVSTGNVLRICRKNYPCVNIFPNDTEIPYRKIEGPGVFDDLYLSNVIYATCFKWDPSEAKQSCKEIAWAKDECMRVFEEPDCSYRNQPFIPMFRKSFVFHPTYISKQDPTYFFNPDCSAVITTPDGHKAIYMGSNKLPKSKDILTQEDSYVPDIYSNFVSAILRPSSGIVLGEWTCICTGDPKITSNATTTFVSTTSQSTSEIDDQTSTLTNNVTTKPSGQNTTTVVAITTSSIILLVIAIIAFVIIRHRLKIKNSDNITHFNFKYDVAEHLKPCLEIQISRKDFDIDEKLGEGKFGIVFHGILKQHKWMSVRMEVAIKMVKPPYTVQNVTSLLNEINVMTLVGSHPNIVCLIGACSSNAHKGELFSLTEFCKNGSIKEYLVKLHKDFQLKCKGQVIALETNSKDPYAKTFDINSSNNEMAAEEKRIRSLLIKWCVEIASAMVFLGEKDIIHIDLAIRNVFLTEDLTSKVGDFGLSRKLQTDEYKKKGNDDYMPWKWLSMESLNCKTFSVKSDVWSYAITCWEMFNLGAEEPYSDISSPGQLYSNLFNGNRLKKPKYSTENEFRVIRKCWEFEPEKRPDFLWLQSFFEDILKEL